MIVDLIAMKQYLCIVIHDACKDDMVKAYTKLQCIHTYLWQ